MSDVRPGLMKDERITWAQLVLMFACGAVAWVGLWHIGRDVYRLVIGLSGCE